MKLSIQRNHIHIRPCTVLFWIVVYDFNAWKSIRCLGNCVFAVEAGIAAAAELKAADERTEEEKMALLGRPRLGDVSTAQIRIKESKEFKNTVDKLVQRANASIILGKFEYFVYTWLLFSCIYLDQIASSHKMFVIWERLEEKYPPDFSYKCWFSTELHFINYLMSSPHYNKIFCKFIKLMQYHRYKFLEGAIYGSSNGKRRRRWRGWWSRHRWWIRIPITCRLSHAFSHYFLESVICFCSPNRLV